MSIKSLSEREYRALVSLLADDDVKVLHTVWEHLLEIGPPALAYLREASEDPDPRTRIRARHIMARIVLEDLEERFRALAERDDESFSLEDGVFTISRIEYPELDRDEFRDRLDALAAPLREELQGPLPAHETIRRVNRYLFEDLKFSGNNTEYYNPDNSYINRVIDKRTGIPITLSALYLLLGDRLGLPVKGIGLPGHFLVKYEDGETEIFIDPYNGGKLLTRKDCAQYLTGAGYYFKEEYIAISSSRDIVIRMLRNLVLIYSKQQDKQRVRRLTHYVEILQTREKAR
ncbi:MAG: transglutaminase family protein [Candidatus Eisenbacteria bacterium]|nr:transglutaminase-like domain-containing protein [Candidatus Eisenbacteria bacterium]